jgi:hypothetical protein
MTEIKFALSELAQFFDEARATNEFQFVLTLINYRGMGSWETTSNLHEWFDAIEYYRTIYQAAKGKEKTRIGCLLYSTFFENSDFYNILGSLSLIKMSYGGSSYLFWKTKKYERLLGTGEKVRMVSELLEDAGKSSILNFFEENHVEQIRNTYFHSAYSLAGDDYILHDSDPIIVGGVGQRSVDVNTFICPRVENVIAFFDLFKKLYFRHFESYKTNKLIKGHFPNLRDITIIGSERGLAGFNVEKTAQFFGEWVDSGIYYDERWQMWAGKNLVMNMPRVEDIEIEERIRRYEDKHDIKVSSTELFNLIDKLIDRKNSKELQKAVLLLVKFGDIKYKKWEEEQNYFKKRSLSAVPLPFYKKAIVVNDMVKSLDMKEIQQKIKTLEG